VKYYDNKIDKDRIYNNVINNKNRNKNNNIYKILVPVLGLTACGAVLFLLRKRNGDKDV